MSIGLGNDDGKYHFKYSTVVSIIDYFTVLEYQLSTNVDLIAMKCLKPDTGTVTEKLASRNG